MNEEINDPSENEPINAASGAESQIESDEILGTDNSVINSSGDNALNIDKSVIENLNHITVNYESEITETTFPCPECHTPLDARTYGKFVCTNPECRKTLFRLNTKLEVTEFPTISDDKESKEYKKILTHINNKLKHSKYEDAYNYCLKAEEIAPAEATTWKYFALCEFLFEINIRYGKKRKSTQQIVNSVKTHLVMCREYGISDSGYEELCGDIANKLFYLERSRLNSIRHLSRDSNGVEILVSKYLNLNLSFLKSYELCFSLYEDTRYLEEYVKELSKPFKWIIKDSNDLLQNKPACGNYTAVLNRERLINKILLSSITFLKSKADFG